MGSADGVGIGAVNQEHPRAHHIIRGCSGLVQGGGDDVQAPACLAFGVIRAGTVLPDRRGAGHDHPVAHPDRPAEADRGFERGS